MEVLKGVDPPENNFLGSRTLCICPLCLSKDRNFIMLDDKLMKLTAALDIFSKETFNRAVCWECYANLQKIDRFKGTALQALQILQGKKPMVILNTNLSRLKKVSQTGVISVTANDMDKEIEEVMSPPYLPSPSSSLPSPSSLPSASSLQSPSSLPPLPPLQPSPSISIKLKQGDLPKLAKFAPKSNTKKSNPKPVYIFVEKQKTVEKTAPPNHLGPVITKHLQKKDAKASAYDETVLNSSQVTNRALKTHKLGKIMTSDDKAKMSPTMEAISQETVIISESEFDDISDHDTPLYLSYEDGSDDEMEELHYDSEPESENYLIIANDELTHSSDTPATVKSTNNQDIEEHNTNEKSVVNNFYNDSIVVVGNKSKNLNILVNDTVQKVQKRNITKHKNNNTITTCKVYSIANNNTNDKILRKDNNIDAQDTEKQKIHNKITIHDLPYCTAENVEKQDTNVKILSDIILKTTSNNMDQPNNISELIQEYRKQEQPNAILQKASSVLCVNEQNISVVQTKDVLSGANHLNRDIAKCGDDNINVDISNCGYNNTVTDIQRCVGKSTECEVLLHNENNTDTRKPPQLPIDNDKMSPDENCFSKNDTHLQSIGNDSITKETHQQYSENGKNTDCEVLKYNKNNIDTRKPPEAETSSNQNNFSENDTHLESIDNDTITKENPQKYSKNGKNVECDVLIHIENNTDTHKPPQIPIDTDKMSTNQNNFSENDTYIESIDNDTITKENPQKYSENGKNTECDVLIRNENDTDKLPQIRHINDKMNPGQKHSSENDTHIEPVDRDAMANEKPQIHTENACQTLLKELKAKPQLIVNKVTDDMLWNKVNNKESNKILNSHEEMKPQFKNARTRKRVNEIKQNINVDTLQSSVIVLRDHWYAKDNVSKLNQIHRKIRKKNKIITSDCPKEESIKRITTRPLTSLRNTTLIVVGTEINDLYANDVSNEDCLRASVTNTEHRENDHLNFITINNMTDEHRSLSPVDITISNVNMSVSIDLREFFPELPVCNEDVISNDINIEYGAAETNEKVDYSVRQCEMEQEDVHIKVEPIDGDDKVTDDATENDYYFENNEQDFNYTYDAPVNFNCATPSVDDNYNESYVSNGDLSNLINENFQKETDYEKNSLIEKEIDLKINLIARKLFKQLTDNTLHLNLTTEYREEQENIITSVLKSRDCSEVVRNTGGVKYNSEHLTNIEDHLLEPVCFTDWTDETYSHVTIDNKNKSNQSRSEEGMSMKVKNNNHRKQARRPNIKEKRKRKASEQKKNPETQSKSNLNNRDNSKSRFFPKRIKRDNNDMKETIMEKKKNDDKLMLPSIVEPETNYKPLKKRMKKDINDTKQAIIQKRINEDKLFLPSIVESKTNYNPNKKIMKKNSKDIKEAIIQEKINDKLLSHPIMGSEENNNSDQPNSENKTNQSNSDKIAPIDFMDKNHEITLNEIEGLSDENIALEKLSTDSKEINESSYDTNVVVENQCNIMNKTVKVLSKKIEDSQLIKEQIHVPGEIVKGKLLQYPVIELEINVKIDRFCETEAEGKKLNEMETNPERNESQAHKITPTDFIENNKEITLDELEGEFSDDELIFDTDYTKTDDPRTEMDMDEEEINKHTNKKNEQNIVMRSEDGVDEEELEKMKNDSVFKDTQHRCLLCMQVFSTKLGLTNHMKKHEKSGNFKCGMCSNKYRTIGGLRNHTNLKHRRIRSSTCRRSNRFDDLSVSSPNQLTTHSEKSLNNLNSTENNVSSKESEPSPMEEIESTDNTQFTEKDKSTNTPVEKPYCCFICNKQYDCYDKLFDHQVFKHNDGKMLSSNHKNNGLLICFVCQKLYVKFTSMFWHQIVKHAALRDNSSTDFIYPKSLDKSYKYLCFKCSDRFESFSKLLSHQIECHNFQFDGMNSKNNLSVTENSLSSTGNNLTLTENNLSTTGNIATLPEHNLNTTGNILTSTENKSSSGNKSRYIYEYFCFLCNNRYKRFDSLLIHQRLKH